MKFQWYVIDRDDGTIQGSNDVDEIRSCLEDDNYVVLTAQHGKYFCGSTKEQEVPAYQSEDDVAPLIDDSDLEYDGDDDDDDDEL